MKKRILFLLVTLFAVSCILAGCDGSSSHSTPPRPSVAESPFQKGPIKVEAIIPVEMTGRSADEWVLLTTLQGIVARKSATQLFLVEDNDDSTYFANTADTQHNPPLTSGTKFILDYLTNVSPKIPQVPTEDSFLSNADIWTIVKYFRDKGYVSSCINYGDTGTAWQNIAVTLSGVEGSAIPMSSTQANDANNPLGPCKDVSTDYGLSSSYPYNYYDLVDGWMDSLNKGFVIELNPGQYDGPEDYAAMLGGLVFNTHDDITSRISILNKLNPDSTDNPSAPIPVFGWDTPEYNFVDSVSFLGDFVVASNISHNLSLLSSTDTRPLSVKTAPPETYQCGMEYTTFIMSDGDNLQILTNNINSEIWWGSQHRGKFPVGWTISPAMYYLEPDVWHFFVNTAKPTDEFVAGPSTMGYVMGKVADKTYQFSQQLEKLSTFMADSGITTSLVFGSEVAPQDDWNNLGYLQGILGISEMQGAFYQGFDGGPSSVARFLNDKPITAFLSSIDATPDSVAKRGGIGGQAIEISEWLNSGYYINGGNNGFFAIYGVRNINNADKRFITNDLMGAFNTLYTALDSSKVKVVTPSQFVNLQKQAQNSVPQNSWYWRIVSSGDTSTIETSNIPPGTTVDWFTDGCGMTPVPGGASPVVGPGQYYGRARNLTSGCPSWTCVEVYVNPL